MQWGHKQLEGRRGSNYEKAGPHRHLDLAVAIDRVSPGVPAAVRTVAPLPAVHRDALAPLVHDDAVGAGVVEPRPDQVEQDPYRLGQREQLAEGVAVRLGPLHQLARVATSSALALQLRDVPGQLLRRPNAIGAVIDRVVQLGQRGGVQDVGDDELPQR